MLFKRSLIIIFFLGLSGCGFKPMLSQESHGNKAIEEVRIASVEGEDKFRLKRIISESFATDSRAMPLYDLNIKITHENTEQSILKNNQVTRYRIKITMSYNLVDLETKKTMDKGSLYLYSSYDTAYSEFMNYMSERSISDNILKELCEDLKLRLNLLLTATKDIKNK